MSGLIKSIAKHVKKQFKRVTKVIKKIASSKIFKAVAMAAAIYFTAGAAAGFLGGAGAAGAGATAAAGVGTAATAAATTAGAAATTAAAAGSVAAATGTAAASTGIMATIAANPLIASAALTTGGQILGQHQTAKAENKAYERDKADLLEANKTQLDISGKSNAIGERAYLMSQNNDGTPVKTQSYYDQNTDTYRNV